MRVLVVDDDQVFREELGALLEDGGHEVVLAPSAPKALAALEQREFDLVFTDLKMPRQSGLSLLREAKARWPRLFVVVITGFATVETAVEAMKLGAFDYVRKPFQSAQIQRVLDLAQQELAYSGRDLEPRDPLRLAGAWAADQGREVLFLGPKPARPVPHVTAFPVDGAEPARLVDAVRAFVAETTRPAVVLAGVEAFFQHHRVEDVVAVLVEIRRLLEGKGPLAVGFDPHRLAHPAAVGVRAALAAGDSGATLEALTSPIRRLVLRRLADGPGSFTDAMRAAQLDDSPKLSFHMRRLVDEELIVHAQETYRLTPKGEAAVHLLDEIDALNVGGDGPHVLFTAAATGDGGADDRSNPVDARSK